MATGEKPKLVAIVDDDELIRDALGGLMKAAGLPLWLSRQRKNF
jgi:FixJ family two-component response regulator